MPPFDEVTCGGVQALLEPYVDGELAAPEAARLRTHLDRCPACAADLRLAAGICRALRDLPELDAPPRVLDRTMAQIAAIGQIDAIAPSRRGAAASQAPKVMAILRARPGGGMPWRRFALPAAAGIAALLAAALLMLYSAGSGRNAPRPGLPGRLAGAGEPSPAAVTLAVRQARYALAYVGRASRHAGLTVRDEVLERRVVLPAILSATRPLHPNLGFHPEPSARKGT